ncbi:MAG: hypothetical protein H6739_35120 [Alphaproteobacteria bacterium]|nr:hypothetical protein [Alphaproteobacteria bacterium]
MPQEILHLRSSPTFLEIVADLRGVEVPDPLNNDTPRVPLADEVAIEVFEVPPCGLWLQRDGRPSLERGEAVELAFSLPIWTTGELDTPNGQITIGLSQEVRRVLVLGLDDYNAFTVETVHVPTGDTVTTETSWSSLLGVLVLDSQDRPVAVNGTVSRGPDIYFTLWERSGAGLTPLYILAADLRAVPTVLNPGASQASVTLVVRNALDELGTVSFDIPSNGEVPVFVGSHGDLTEDLPELAAQWSEIVAIRATSGSTSDPVRINVVMHGGVLGMDRTRTGVPEQVTVTLTDDSALPWEVPTLPNGGAVHGGASEDAQLTELVLYGVDVTDTLRRERLRLRAFRRFEASQRYKNLYGIAAWNTRERGAGSGTFTWRLGPPAEALHTFTGPATAGFAYLHACTPPPGSSLRVEAPEAAINAQLMILGRRAGADDLVAEPHTILSTDQLISLEGWTRIEAVRILGLANDLAVNLHIPSTRAEVRSDAWVLFSAPMARLLGGAAHRLGGRATVRGLRTGRSHPLLAIGAFGMEDEVVPPPMRHSITPVPFAGVSVVAPCIQGDVTFSAEDSSLAAFKRAGDQCVRVLNGDGGSLVNRTAVLAPPSTSVNADEGEVLVITDVFPSTQGGGECCFGLDFQVGTHNTLLLEVITAIDLGPDASLVWEYFDATGNWSPVQQRHHPDGDPLQQTGQIRLVFDADAAITQIGAHKGRWMRVQFSGGNIITVPQIRRAYLAQDGTTTRVEEWDLNAVYLARHQWCSTWTTVPDPDSMDPNRAASSKRLGLIAGRRLALTAKVRLRATDDPDHEDLVWSQLPEHLRRAQLLERLEVEVCDGASGFYVRRAWPQPTSDDIESGTWWLQANETVDGEGIYHMRPVFCPSDAEPPMGLDYPAWHNGTGPVFLPKNASSEDGAGYAPDSARWPMGELVARHVSLVAVARSWVSWLGLPADRATLREPDFDQNAARAVQDMVGRLVETSSLFKDVIGQDQMPTVAEMMPLFDRVQKLLDLSKDESYSNMVGKDTQEQVGGPYYNQFVRTAEGMQVGIASGGRSLVKAIHRHRALLRGRDSAEHAFLVAQLLVGLDGVSEGEGYLDTTVWPSVRHLPIRSTVREYISTGGQAVELELDEVGQFVLLPADLSAFGVGSIPAVLITVEDRAARFVRAGGDPATPLVEDTRALALGLAGFLEEGTANEVQELVLARGSTVTVSQADVTPSVRLTSLRALHDVQHPLTQVARAYWPQPQEILNLVRWDILNGVQESETPEAFAVMLQVPDTLRAGTHHLFVIDPLLGPANLTSQRTVTISVSEADRLWGGLVHVANVSPDLGAVTPPLEADVTEVKRGDWLAFVFNIEHFPMNGLPRILASWVHDAPLVVGLPNNPTFARDRYHATDRESATAELAPLLVAAPTRSDPELQVSWLSIRMHEAGRSASRVVQLWPDGFHSPPEDGAPQAIAEDILDIAAGGSIRLERLVGDTEVFLVARSSTHSSWVELATLVDVAVAAEFQGGADGFNYPMGMAVPVPSHVPSITQPLFVDGDFEQPGTLYASRLFLIHVLPSDDQEPAQNHFVRIQADRSPVLPDGASILEVRRGDTIILVSEGQPQPDPMLTVAVPWVIAAELPLGHPVRLAPAFSGLPTPDALIQQLSSTEWQLGQSFETYRTAQTTTRMKLSTSGVAQKLTALLAGRVCRWAAEGRRRRHDVDRLTDLLGYALISDEQQDALAELFEETWQRVAARHMERERLTDAIWSRRRAVAYAMTRSAVLAEDPGEASTLFDLVVAASDANERQAAVAEHFDALKAELESWGAGGDRLDSLISETTAALIAEIADRTASHLLEDDQRLSLIELASHHLLYGDVLVSLSLEEALAPLLQRMYQARFQDPVVSQSGFAAALYDARQYGILSTLAAAVEGWTSEQDSVALRGTVGLPAGSRKPVVANGGWLEGLLGNMGQALQSFILQTNFARAANRAAYRMTRGTLTLAAQMDAWFTRIVVAATVINHTVKAWDAFMEGRRGKMWREGTKTAQSMFFLIFGPRMAAALGRGVMHFRRLAFVFAFAGPLAGGLGLLATLAINLLIDRMLDLLTRTDEDRSLTASWVRASWFGKGWGLDSGYFRERSWIATARYVVAPARSIRYSPWVSTGGPGLGPSHAPAEYDTIHRTLHRASRLESDGRYVAVLGEALGETLDTEKLHRNSRSVLIEPYHFIGSELAEGRLRPDLHLMNLTLDEVFRPLHVEAYRLNSSLVGTQAGQVILYHALPLSLGELDLRVIGLTADSHDVEGESVTVQRFAEGADLYNDTISFRGEITLDWPVATEYAEIRVKRPDTSDTWEAPYRRIFLRRPDE